MKGDNIAFLLVLIAFNSVRYTEQLNTVFDWDLVTYENGTVVVVDKDETYTESEKTLAELKENVGFALYRSINDDACTIYLGNDDTLTDCKFDPNLPTRMIIHGWNAGLATVISTSIRDAFFDVGDYNVVVVYWDSWAKENYISARMKVVAIGQYLSLFIDWLVTFGMSTKDLIVIGHSLGAHIAGVACRNASSECGTVIGLDPAGPLFYGEVMNARLTNNDAKCVEVIHTSASILKLGYNAALGDIDHWPNGGSRQAGCGLDLLATCSHERSYMYYAESIRNGNKFTSYSCGSYLKFEFKRCKNNRKTYLGHACELGAKKGNYYLKTHKKSPYAKG